MTTRIEKGLKLAYLAALESDRPFRVGAAVFSGPRLVSTGKNSARTNPRAGTRNRTEHAEFNCLVGTRKRRLDGSEVFVVRVLRDGRRALARPCFDCRANLARAGVSRVWYTGYDGRVECEKLRA